MKRRSLTGPILLILLGAAFLIYNLRPDIEFFDLLSQYWPFLLIAWGSLRLVEVLVDYFRGSLANASGFTGGEVVLIVFICFIGWGAFEAHNHGVHFRPAWEAFGEHYDFNVADQKPAGNVTRVVFENNRGNLKVVGADTTEVKVTGRKTIQAMNQTEADRGNDRTPLEIVTQGDTITVRTNQDRNPTSGKISEDLEITVPSRVSVELHGNYGDFDVSEVNGSVDLQSDRADVRLNKIGGNARVELQRSDLVRAADLKGNMDLQGKGSDIELENIAGQVTINGSYSGNLEFKNLAKPLHFESPNTDLQVAALPGQISMDLGELTGNNLVGPVHLVTKSKDVKIEDFSNSLELETERGDIDLQPKHMPLAKIDARSRSGQISLVLPDKAAFQLVATTDHGEAVNDFGAPIQKETDGRSSSLKGTVGQGASIHVVTERGTVTVRKAGSETEETEKPDKAET
jgi:putative adhesin